MFCPISYLPRVQAITSNGDELKLSPASREKSFAQSSKLPNSPYLSARLPLTFPAICTEHPRIFQMTSFCDIFTLAGLRSACQEPK
jgi:hypothetical protein